MTTLLQVLQQADARRIAVGHFNVSDLVTLYGVVEAARQLRLPVVVGASEAERRFIGVQQLVAIVQSLRDRGGSADLSERRPQPLVVRRPGGGESGL